MPGINNDGINRYTGRNAHVDILENFFNLKLFFKTLKKVVQKHENLK